MRVRKKILFWVFILLGFHLVVSFIWLSLDTRPPKWDQANHLALSLGYYYGFLSGEVFSRLLSLSSYYPPFFHLVASFFYRFFGTSPDLARGTQFIFFALLLLSTWKIGKRFFGEKEALITCFLLSFYPAIWLLSREYLLDLPLTGMVTLGIWLLLESKRFTHPLSSLLFGVVSGLGVLTKWSYPFFLFGPFLLVLLGKVPSEKREEIPNLKVFWLFVSLGTGILIALPWYSFNLPKLFPQLIFYGLKVGRLEGEAPIFSFSSFSFYFKTLFNYQLLLPYFLVFGFSLLSLNWRMWEVREKKAFLFLLFWIILPYLFLSLLGNKNERYTVPYLPGVALISGWGIGKMKKRKMVGVVLIGYSLFQFFLSGFLSPPPSWVKYKLVFKSSSPKRENWKIEEILAKVRETFPPSVSHPLLLGVVPNSEYFNPQTFNYYTVLYRLPLWVVPVGQLPNFSTYVYRCDYILTKTGDQGPSYTLKYIKEAVDFLKDPPQEFKKRFTLLKTFSLPDSSLASLYKRLTLP